MYKVYASLFIFTLCFTPLVQAEQPKVKVVVLSGSFQWQPYAYINAEGDFKGDDIELLQAALSTLGYQLDYVLDVPRKRLVRSAGKLDHNTIIGATFTEQRSEVFYFSVPYRNETIAAFSLGKKLSEYTNVAQLLKSRLQGAANMAAFYGKEFEGLKVLYAYNLSHIETSERRVELLKKGRVDYIIGDVGHLNYIKEEFEPNIQISPFSVTKTQVSFMFSKTDFDLIFIDKFNAALKTILEGRE